MGLNLFSRSSNQKHKPWNKGKLLGQKPALKLKEIWSIRIRLQLEHRDRDYALFNLAIDSKLRGCDLVSLTVNDVSSSAGIRKRTGIRQRKTKTPVQFEITEITRESLARWIEKKNLHANDYLFPSVVNRFTHLTTRQYSRLLDKWLGSIGLNSSSYGTHSLRRTKVSLIYKRTGNIRAVQLLLGHTNLQSTVRYLGIEVDDALEISEQIDL